MIGRLHLTLSFFVFVMPIMASCSSAQAQAEMPSSQASISYATDSKRPEPAYRGLSISQWIQTKTLLNTNRLSLSKLLTFKQVSDQDESGIVEFELPISYDVLKTNWWSIDLGVINKNGDFALCDLYDCERATNGDCLLCWNTAYDAPRKYNLRVRLTCDGPKLQWDSITIIGPALPFLSTNVIQYFESSSMFDSNSVPLVAKLIKPVATFKIEITTPKGKHLKTITGHTTNGWISVEWNLIGDDGKKFEADTISTKFDVAYPDQHRPTHIGN
jgi:hypothetical protein